MDKIISAQLGRDMLLPAKVVKMCHLGLPIVIESGGETPSGRPFPNRFWLSCPLANKRIGRLESDGAVKQLNKRLLDDQRFNDAVKEAHDEHDARTNDSRGIGGTRSSIKCLHAHGAYSFAGGTSPAGEYALERITPLTCIRPCVSESDGKMQKNPDWRPAPLKK